MNQRINNVWREGMCDDKEQWRKTVQTTRVSDGVMKGNSPVQAAPVLLFPFSANHQLLFPSASGSLLHKPQFLCVAQGRLHLPSESCQLSCVAATHTFSWPGTGAEVPHTPPPAARSTPMGKAQEFLEAILSAGTFDARALEGCVHITPGPVHLQNWDNRTAHQLHQLAYTPHFKPLLPHQYTNFSVCASVPHSGFTNRLCANAMQDSGGRGGGGVVQVQFEGGCTHTEQIRWVASLWCAQT